jgi:predicted ArsR family transcriptional regulator
MTRGRIVLLLRRSARTIDELAEVLGLTRTAVREHLATLERDGLVHRSGVRRGISKPAQLYSLTPEAAELFPRGYAPVLDGLLAALAQQLPPAALEALLRDVGRRLVAGQPIRRGGMRDRVAVGTELLNELGGLAEAREVDGRLVIQGWSCPLAAVVVDHPELCLLVETMLTEIVGLPVYQRCDRRAPPRCFFEVADGDAGRSPRTARSSTPPRRSSEGAKRAPKSDRPSSTA